MDLKTYVRGHEGCRLATYDDKTGGVVVAGGLCEGTLTCGIGHTGPDVYAGQIVDQAQADEWFAEDLARATDQAAADLGEGHWAELDEMRQAALVDMAFQMGGAGLGEFRHMLAAIRAEDWASAATNLLASRYAEEVPHRAEDNYKILLTGAWPAKGP